MKGLRGGGQNSALGRCSNSKWIMSENVKRRAQWDRVSARSYAVYVRAPALGPVQQAVNRPVYNCNSCWSRTFVLSVLSFQLEMPAVNLLIASILTPVRKLAVLSLLPSTSSVLSLHTAVLSVLGELAASAEDWQRRGRKASHPSQDATLWAWS